MRGVDVRDQPLQRALGAERGEVRDLRLEGAGVIGRGIDDGAAEREHRVRIVLQVCWEFRRFRIEADADQGAGIGPALAKLCHEAHGRGPA